MRGAFRCPECGSETPLNLNPFPTADCIIEYTADDGREAIVLIWRKNEPVGWAIPGGFVDYGESVEDAVRREMKEETNLELKDLQLLGVYSDPDRDPRFHTVSTVYIARGAGRLEAGDDAVRAVAYALEDMPSEEEIVFDHFHIISDYLQRKKERRETDDG